MAIKRASDPSAVIEPGKYIMSGSIMVYGICGKPGIVRSLSGKRVYYERIHRDGTSDENDLTHINADKIVFVCDTLEELDSLRAVEQASYTETGAAVKEVEAKYAAKFAAQIEALIAGAA